MNRSDSAKLSLSDAVARFANHRISRIAIRDRENVSGPERGFLDGGGFFERGSQRLVANHMDSGFQERHGGFGMKVVRSYYDHGFDSVGPSGFRLGHFLEGIVASRRVELQVRGGGGSNIRIRRQRSRDKFEIVVQPCRGPMHMSDEAIPSSSEHAVSDRFQMALHRIASLLLI